jgi:hypothetical protein
MSTIARRRTATTPTGVGCDHANLSARWDAAYGSYAQCEDCDHTENPEGGPL